MYYIHVKAVGNSTEKTINFPFFLSNSFKALHIIEWSVETDVLTPFLMNDTHK
jgi:hypothetical protein